MPRRRLSETIVYWLLPFLLIYMAGYAVFVLVKPLFGY